MNVFALEGATPGLAVCVALALAGAPGADNTAAARVTDVGTGTVALLGAEDIPLGRVSDTALVVAEEPDVAGVPAGGVAGDTDAVIE